MSLGKTIVCSWYKGVMSPISEHECVMPYIGMIAALRYDKVCVIVWCVTVWCSVLQCGASCCSVLQRVAVC